MPSKPVTYSILLLAAVLGAAMVLAIGTGGTDSSAPDLAGVQWQPRAPMPSDGPEEGEPAPDFHMETLGGAAFHLAEHAGEVVVVNFWATWCAPCRVEIPDLIEMQAELTDKGVRFVGVSVDHEDDAVIRSFAEGAGINYPVIVDDGSISEKYGGVYALPMTFVIDRSGIVRFRKAGIVSRSTLMPMLEDLAAG